MAIFMKLIVTRHGETVENRKGIIQGHLNIVLSEKGLEQADLVALRLKDEHIDAIYSSDLDRAAETARRIVKFHPSIKIHFTKKLRERYLGEFQGKSRKEVGWDKIEPGGTYTHPKDGETVEDMYERARKFIDSVLHKHKNDTVLVVAHNYFNKALIAIIENKSAMQIDSIPNMKNTNISIYEIDEKSRKMLLFNCVKHLE